MGTAEIVISPEQGAIEPLLLDFLAYLELERGLSRNTLEAYRSDLLQFGRVHAPARRERPCRAARRPGRVPVRARRSRARARRERSGWARAADEAQATGAAAGGRCHAGRKVACLRSFYRHLRREGLIEHDPASELHGPRKTQRLPRVLTREEVARLLREPKGTEPLALRDRALLEVMYACGLRVSEVTGLQLGDVDLDEGMLRARGKGSKERLVPVGRHASTALCAYLARGRPRAARRARRADAVSEQARRRPDPPGAVQDRARPRARRRPAGAHEPAHAAPLVRHSSARRRL